MKKVFLNTLICIILFGSFASSINAATWETPSSIENTWNAVYPDISDNGNTIVYLDISNTYN